MAAEQQGLRSNLYDPAIGVLAQITPWNYPLMMAAWKIGPRARCRQYRGPQSGRNTPEIAVLLALIAARHLPAGVFNVVCGDLEMLRAWTAHPTPQMVALTGSTHAGNAVARTAAAYLKLTHLELGGKAPAAVLGDAALDAAATATGAFYNAGQNCTATTRVLVHDRVARDFPTKFVREAERTRTGVPTIPLRTWDN